MCLYINILELLHENDESLFGGSIALLYAHVTKDLKVVADKNPPTKGVKIATIIVVSLLVFSVLSYFTGFGNNSAYGEKGVKLYFPEATGGKLGIVKIKSDEYKNNKGDDY